MTSEREKRERWSQTRIVAEIWWCGDDYCDCTQPQIIRITPNEDAGYPVLRREVVWSGEFLTDTWEYKPGEREELQYAPLREACGLHGVAVPAEAEATPEVQRRE